MEAPHLVTLGVMACVVLTVRGRPRTGTGTMTGAERRYPAGTRTTGEGTADEGTAAGPVGAVAVSLALAGAALVVSAPALAPVLMPPGELAAAVPARGAELWRSGAVVLVLDDPDGATLLEGLRAEGVRRVDVVVARRGSAPAATTVSLLRSRLPVGAVLGPEGHRIRDAVVPVPGAVVEVGGLRVAVGATAPVLVAEVEVAPAAP